MRARIDIAGSHGEGGGPIIWDDSGTSRDNEHTAVVAIIVDMDRVPRTILRRILHLPGRRKRSDTWGDQLCT